MLKKVGAFFVDKTVCFFIPVCGHAFSNYRCWIAKLKDYKIARLQNYEIELLHSTLHQFLEILPRKYFMKLANWTAIVIEVADPR